MPIYILNEHMGIIFRRMETKGFFAWQIPSFALADIFKYINLGLAKQYLPKIFTQIYVRFSRFEEAQPRGVVADVEDWASEHRSKLA